MRRVIGDILVVATHNEGKLQEISTLLSPFDIEVRSAASFGLPAPPETGRTFSANARIKADLAALAIGLPALADDSGLEVDALDGEPGVYSADWAETPQGRDYGMAMERIRSEASKRGFAGPWSARFCTTLCLVWPDREFVMFEGSVEGELIWPPSGTNGFGYDPMFVPEGSDLTFGEMTPEEKQAFSHRARAFGKLVDGLLR